MLADTEVARVLSITAHPDDVDFGAAGTIASWPDAGIEVVYEGIRLTPQQIAASALEEGVHVVGLSILSGSHLELVPQVVEALAQAGVRVPLVVGGIIPDADVAELLAGGVAAVYTPKDFELATIVGDIVALVDPGDGAR